MRRTLCVGIAIVALAGGGCGSMHYREDEMAAKGAVKDAKKAGATKESLRVANESITFARRAEKSASNDLDQASKDITDAQARYDRAARKQFEHKNSLAQSEALIDATSSELDRSREREEALRFKGVTEDELKNLTGPEQGLAQLRLDNLKTTRDTLKKQLDLCDLEFKDAEIHLTAARSRQETARQRLEVARSLIRQAELQARVARGEALAMQRASATRALSSETP
jgi:hypothetical protein